MVSAGDISTCAITVDDELFCFGHGELGQLGNGSVAVAQPPTQVAGAWKTVSIAGFHACGVKTDQTLWCWGLNQSGAVGTGVPSSKQAVPVKISEALFAQVATGEAFSCAIEKTGALWCWGDNAFGQLGEGSGMDRGTPVMIGSAAWSQISLGQRHACGIQIDDSLWCWGDGSLGQVGNGVEGTFNVPVKIAGTWDAVRASVVHTCAIDKGGSVWCWGQNYSGMLGDGTYQESLVPKRTSVRAQTLAVGTYHTCAIDANDDVWCWGGTTRGEFGVEISDDVLTPMKVATAESIDGGGTITCTIGGGGRLFCAGANQFGQTGQPFGEVHELVQTDTRTDWGKIFASRRHACAITRSNTEDVWCWGDGYAGQIGDGDNYDRQTPKLAGSGFRTLALGEPTTAAIKTVDNTLWIWGEHIDNVNHLTPEQVRTDTSAVAVGDAHGCGITNGILRCGGYNERGQLGDGTTMNRTNEVTVAGTWTNVWAGYDTTCAMAQTNGLFCWGQGDSGQLGNGTMTDATTPQPVGLTDVAIVRIGLDFACALRGTDGTLWCWGEASFGQFGNGTPGNSAVPVQVQPEAATRWSSLAVGDSHVCAITSSSELYCWGHGDEGQIGDPSLVQRNAPRLVSGGWADVAAGDHFTCAIKLDGTRWCFGANGDGQLGNGRAWHATFLQVP